MDRSPKTSLFQRTVLSLSTRFVFSQCLSKKHRKRKKTINNLLGWPLHFLVILHSQGCVHQKNELWVPGEKALQQWRQNESCGHLEPEVRWIYSCNRQQLLPNPGLTNSDVQSEFPCCAVISFLLIAVPIAGDFEREICIKKTPNLWASTERRNGDFSENHTGCLQRTGYSSESWLESLNSRVQDVWPGPREH